MRQAALCYQDNKYGLNLGKTVFVIDSPISAYMASIIADGEPINVVLEIKGDLETVEASQMLESFTRSCITINTINRVNLPNRFYVSGKDFFKILRIWKATRHLYSGYTKDTVFIGASTSTFMRSLHCKRENIAFLYHGMTDQIRKEDEEQKRKGLKALVKRLIFGNVLRLPYSVWCNFWPDKAFSLCKLDSAEAKWLNLFDFQSEVLEKRLKGIVIQNGGKKNVLFFPIVKGHTASGVDADTTFFDDVNVKLLLKHINPVTDRVYIKYHPWLYRTSSALKSDFISILADHGIEAYDIGAMIPEDIGGPLLPTEVLCRFLRFDKLIAEDTSTMWYLYATTPMEKILDISFADQGTKRLLTKCYHSMEKKCSHNSVEIYY